MLLEQRGMYRECCIRFGVLCARVAHTTPLEACVVDQGIAVRVLPCAVCPAGTQPDGNGGCQACPANHISSGSTSSSLCFGVWVPNANKTQCGELYMLGFDASRSFAWPKPQLCMATVAGDVKPQID